MSRLLAPQSRRPVEWTADEWETLVAALTRRKLLGGGLALGLLTACGAAAPPTATTPTTRMIDSAMGRVAVPINPQRIVCLDSYSVSDILDTGLTPIGIPEKMSGAVVPAHTALVPTIATVGGYGQPDLERIASMKPDLILGITIDAVKKVYDQLGVIAPTALFDYAVPDAWRTLAGQFDDAASRTTSLTNFQETYQRRTAALQTTYAAQLRQSRWAFVMGRGDTWQLYTPTSGGGKIMADAGIQFVGAVQGLTEVAKSYSLEQLDLLADADVIATYADREGKPLETHTRLANLPTWQGLAAVKSGRLFYMPDIITFSYNSALGLLDQIEGALKKL